MDLNNYYDYGSTTGTYLNNYLTNNGAGDNPSHTPIYSRYLVSIPVNVNGTLKGVTLNYIQPIEIGRASCRERVQNTVGVGAEDGIRDGRVTGVQTCALPI